MIRVVSMDNLRGLLSIRRMNKSIECTDKKVVWSDGMGEPY